VTNTGAMMRGRITHAVAGLVAAAAAVGVSACGGSSSSTHSSTPATSTPATTAAASTSPAPATPSAGSSAAPAAPGTRLKAGQGAIVQWNADNTGSNANLELTIESIKHGSISDFNGISLSGVPKGATPTYVKLKMTNESGRSLNTGSSDPADSVQAIESDGQGDSNLILEGYFPPCPDNTTPNPFKPGQTFTTCETYFEQGEATQIGWNGSDATINDPVIWSP
jgi:hypothetical protein